MMMALVKRAAKSGLSPVPAVLPWPLVAQFNESKFAPYEARLEWHAGYLHRRTTGVRLQSKWQRRWFFLHDGKIYQYDVGGKLWHFKRGEGDGTLRGSVGGGGGDPTHGTTQSVVCNFNLVGSFAVRPRVERERPYVFELVTPTQPLVVLQAESEDDYGTWMAALNFVKTKLATPKGMKATPKKVISYALRTPPPAMGVAQSLGASAPGATTPPAKMAAEREQKQSS